MIAQIADTLEVSGVGSNGFWEVRNQLNEIVKENFDTLYEGGTRLGFNIGDDYYAPRRVQINDTRIHARNGLKYASGHKYNDDAAPSEKQLRETVADLQALFAAASKNIPAPFVLEIKSNE